MRDASDEPGLEIDVRGIGRGIATEFALRLLQSPAFLFALAMLGVMGVAGYRTFGFVGALIGAAAGFVGGLIAGVVIGLLLRS